MDVFFFDRHRSELCAAFQDAGYQTPTLAGTVRHEAGHLMETDEAVGGAPGETARVEAPRGPLGRAMGPALAQRFLVVDDSQDMRFIVSRTLRKLHPGATVQSACDAVEALGMLHGAGHGEGLVILSDYDMGAGITGTQLLAEIAARHPRAKRVLFTGQAPERIVSASIEPDAILSKDGGMKALREFFAPAVDVALHGHGPVP